MIFMACGIVFRVPEKNVPLEIWSIFWRNIFLGQPVHYNNTYTVGWGLNDPVSLFVSQSLLSARLCCLPDFVVCQTLFSVRLCFLSDFVVCQTLSVCKSLFVCLSVFSVCLSVFVCLLIFVFITVYVCLSVESIILGYLHHFYLGRVIKKLGPMT